MPCRLPSAAIRPLIASPSRCDKRSSVFTRREVVELQRVVIGSWRLYPLLSHPRGCMGEADKVADNGTHVFATIAVRLPARYGSAAEPLTIERHHQNGDHSTCLCRPV